MRTDQYWYSGLCLNRMIDAWMSDQHFKFTTNGNLFNVKMFHVPPPLLDILRLFFIKSMSSVSHVRYTSVRKCLLCIFYWISPQNIFNVYAYICLMSILDRHKVSFILMQKFCRFHLVNGGLWIKSAYECVEFVIYWVYFSICFTDFVIDCVR